ncbi:hypothetical protein, partial [Flavobacterium sp.]|uniref:hypothetical protein n=1 Tax=Flavobacterium sp. TaxID=239 RepID=UPI0025BDB44A
MCICIVASAQELQAPQINQNAIFANPGLAGSKGQTRICTALSAFHANYLSGEGWDSNGNTSQKFRNRNLYSCLVSMDGLILKNKLGIAGYIKNEWHQINDTYNFYQNNTQTNAKYMNYKYTNLLMGFMLAPKFHITSSKENKQDHVLSPAAAIGLKDTRFNYSGENFYNYTTQDSIINGENKNTLNLDYVSASLLYTSPRSYTGIKLNFKNYIHTFLLYNVS